MALSFCFAGQKRIRMAVAITVMLSIYIGKQRLSSEYNMLKLKGNICE